MKKTLATVMAVSLAASSAFAGGPGEGQVDNTVENDNQPVAAGSSSPFGAAPSLGLLGGGAAAAAVAGVAALSLAVALSAGDENSSDDTGGSTGGSN